MGKEVKKILKDSLKDIFCIMVGGLAIMLFWNQVIYDLTYFKEMNYLQGMSTYCFLGVVKIFLFE